MPKKIKNRDDVKSILITLRISPNEAKRLLKLGKTIRGGFARLLKKELNRSKE